MKSRKAPTPIHILVEGENERTYLNCKFRAIQVRMINLWEQNPAKLQDKLANVPAHAQIIVIADTDVLDNANRFIQNIARLKKIFTKAPLVILQIHNFEEELCYSCRCNMGQLFAHFHVKGLNDFKNQFNSECQLDNKLKNIGHDQLLMWTRAEDIAKHNTVFNDIYGYLCTDGEIFKLLINK